MDRESVDMNTWSNISETSDFSSNFGIKRNQNQNSFIQDVEFKSSSESS